MSFWKQRRCKHAWQPVAAEQKGPWVVWIILRCSHCPAGKDFRIVRNPAHKEWS